MLYYIALIERTVFRPFLPFLPAARYISSFERVEFNTSLCSYIRTVINYNNYYLTHASEECHVFFNIFLLFTFLLTSTLHFFGSKCRIPQIRRNIFVSSR